MKKIKQLFKWIKEKWWVLTSAVFAIIALTLKLRPRKNSLSAVNKNRDLENSIDELELESLREENKRNKEALARLGIKVQDLNDEKKRRELEMLESKKRRIRELSNRSNKELADLLKKENEI